MVDTPKVIPGVGVKVKVHVIVDDVPGVTGVDVAVFVAVPCGVMAVGV